MAETLADILDGEPQRIATGYVFTEGPLWDPDGGFLYFVDIRTSRQYRVTPGQPAQLYREDTGGLNGTTFDLEGNLLLCESDHRRVARLYRDGRHEVLAGRYEGKRFNRPNDIICTADGSIFFTDPGYRVPLEQREMQHAGIYRIAPDGALSLVADTEYPNGLAFSPDGRTLYASNTRWDSYIHALELGPGAKLLRRRIFADMNVPEPEPDSPYNGLPDGMKVDAAGRVFCTGTGGTWVFQPDGALIGIIDVGETTANIAFGGDDMRTLFLTATTSVYSIRVKTPGLPTPWQAKKGAG